MSSHVNGNAIASTSRLFEDLKPVLPELPAAEPALIALDAFKVAAACQIRDALGVELAAAYAGIEDGKKGEDLQVAVARFRLPGKNAAVEASKKAVEAFKPNDYLAEARAEGAFLFYNVNRKTLARVVLNQINTLTHLSPAPSYGTNRTGEGKKAIIEYSSPNIAKPFHAGHLRSTIIGQFLVNLYKACGWEVISWNYLGDWGKQFGILAVGYAKYGNDESLAHNANSHLYDVYVKINKDATEESDLYIKEARTRAGKADDKSEPTRTEQEEANAQNSIHNAARAFFRRMEDGDKDAIKEWERFRDLSIVNYRDTYRRLNIEFDVYGGESQVSQKSIEEAVEKLAEKELTKEDKGAVIVDLDRWKLGKTIIKKRDGTAVYITRDIAGAVERMDAHKPDKLIYVVGQTSQLIQLMNAGDDIDWQVASQQDLHLKQFFKVLELMGYEWYKRLEHISYGLVKGMSTRKGTAVFLDQILDEAAEKMHEQMALNEAKYAQIENPKQTADVVGLSAVKVQDFTGKRMNGYDFNWDRMLSFEGDTGPYLQYAHVRLCSIQRKSSETVLLPPPREIEYKIDTSLLVEQKAHDLILILAQYPDAVKAAFAKSEPSTIVSYCWRLSHAVSSAYEVLLVKGADSQPLAEARLFLYLMAKDVLSQAMELLSLTPLDRM